DPVLRFHRVEGDILRDVAASGDADQFADRRLIGRLGKMHDDVPAPVRTLKRGDGRLALKKNLGQEIDDTPCRLFAADREGRAAGAWRDCRSHQWYRKLTQGGSRVCSLLTGNALSFAISIIR